MFKPTRLKLNAMGDAEARESLEQLFAQTEVQRQIAVELHRKSTMAQGEAQKAMVEWQQIQQRFLMEAAKHFPEVAIEPAWFIYRKDGEIYLESPFTERTQRNMIRGQLRLMEQQTAQADEASGDDSSSMYEEDDESSREDEHGNEGAGTA